MKLEMARMWPFDEELTPMSKATYPFSGGKAKLFSALVDLYDQHYYALPRDDEDVVLPARALEHVKLALARLSPEEADTAELLRALEATRQEVYGPHELEEIREVLISQEGEGKGKEGVQESGGPSSQEGAPQHQGNEAAEINAPPGAKGGNKSPKVSAALEPSSVGFVSPRQLRTGAATGEDVKLADGAQHDLEDAGSHPEKTEEHERQQSVQNQVKREPAKGSSSFKHPQRKQSGGSAARPHPSAPTVQIAEGLAQRIAALEAQVAGIRSRPVHPASPGGLAPALEQRIAALERAMKQGVQAGQDIERLQKELATQRQQIVQLQQQVADTQKRVAQSQPSEKLSQNFAELRREMEALEAEQLEMRQGLKDVQAWLDTLKSMLATLTSQVASLEEVVGQSDPTPAPPRKLLDLLTRKKE